MAQEQTSSPGKQLTAAVAAEQPLQLVGAINANHALLAKAADGPKKLHIRLKNSLYTNMAAQDHAPDATCDLRLPLTSNTSTKPLPPFRS